METLGSNMNNQAEILALNYGIKAWMKLRYKSIIEEGDSQPVISLM
jgi:ribonuclease HI